MGRCPLNSGPAGAYQKCKHVRTLNASSPCIAAQYNQCLLSAYGSHGTALSRGAKRCPPTTRGGRAAAFAGGTAQRLNAAGRCNCFDTGVFQFNLQPFPQPETSLLCLFYFSAQPEVRGNPEQHERDDVRLAQLQQQLQQQQALAKREVRVAMVALEEAEAKAECQVEQLATTIQCAVARSTMAGWIIAFSELEALRCCLKDESDVRQRAEAMLAEREQEYSAQVQAAEEAEAKSRLLADAVAQWQVRGVVHDCVCLQLMLASSSRPRIENMFAAGGQEAQSPLCCSHV
eukprot:scaffold18695_cov16-Tisochrysis_lutea.AAC.2